MVVCNWALVFIMPSYNLFKHTVCFILFSACLIKEQSELLTAEGAGMEGIVLLLAPGEHCHVIRDREWLFMHIIYNVVQLVPS